MRYSIDTSAIIDIWQGPYPPDIFPDLPQMLSDLVGCGDLRATDEVLFELQRKMTEAHEWAKAQPHLFVPMDDPIQTEASALLSIYPNLVRERPQRGKADVFVIALAKIQGCSVVTSEKLTNNLNRPNIPDVCLSVGVKYMTLLDLFRDQGWVFNFRRMRDG